MANRIICLTSMEIDQYLEAQIGQRIQYTYIYNGIDIEGFSSLDFNPHIFVDIGDVLGSKLACLEAGESQVMNTYVHEHSIVDVARTMTHFRGVQARVKQAEGFTAMRLFINI